MEEIVELLQQADKRQYGGERVSQLEHALQCAHLAEQAGASSSLIVACLLHDIGHLVDGGDAGLARRGIDARHEGRVDPEEGGPAVFSPGDDDLGVVGRHRNAGRRRRRHAIAEKDQSVGPGLSTLCGQGNTSHVIRLDRAEIDFDQRKRTAGIDETEDLAVVIPHGH